MAGKPQPARQIGKGKLLDLVKKYQNAQKRMADERGALGALMEAAATSDNFDAKALRPLLPLLKLEPGPQAHRWRTMMLYADHLGIGAQGDLEDEIDKAAAREEEEAEEDGDENDEGDAETAERVKAARELAEDAGGEDAPTDPVDAVLAGTRGPELSRFRDALRDCANGEAVNKGLERFTIDFPDHAEAALDLAQARLAEIGREAGGGEDLRSDATRKAEAQAAADATHAATGKKPRKRSTRSDAGKIGQEGPAFGAAKAQPSVH